MPINFDTLVVFPNLVTDIVYERLKLLDVRLNVVNRGVRAIDPDLTVGIYPEAWQPVDSSEEFLGLETGPASVATLGEYFFQIHTVTSGYDQTDSQRRHSLLAKVVRDCVEFDGPLRVALAGLPPVVVAGKTETFKGIKMLSQAYFPIDKASTGFVNVGALRCKITTETKVG